VGIASITEETSGENMRGVVTYVSKNTDYCFLAVEGSKDSFFLHCKDAENRVIPPIDSLVEFEIIKRDNRERAVNARQVGGPTSIDAGLARYLNATGD
jgi:hypothetical protein